MTAMFRFWEVSTLFEFLKQLPDYYRKSAFVRSLVQANETEFQRLYQRLREYERER